MAGEDVRAGIDIAKMFVEVGLAGIPDPLSVIDFITWLIGIFSGVPHDAKTAGTAWWLLRSNDPATIWLGANMLAGAHQGRVFSESKPYPQSFEGLLDGLGYGLFKLGNYNPPGSLWHERTSNASATGWVLGPFPPPPGAPYSQNTEIGMWTPKPLDGAAYQRLNGFPAPTLPGLAQFINSGDAIRWFDLPQTESTFGAVEQDSTNRWMSAYQRYSSGAQPPPTPGPAPAPAPDPNIAAIRQCICDELVPQQSRLADRITDILDLARSEADFAKEGPIKRIWEQLSELRQGVNADLNAWVNKLAPEGIAELKTLAAAVERMAATEHTIDPELVAAINRLEHCLCVEAPDKVAAAIDKAAKEGAKDDAELWDVPKAILDQLEREGVLTPEMGQLLGGSPFGRVLSAIAHWSPFDAALKVDKWIGKKLHPALPSIDAFVGNISDGLIEVFDKWLTVNEKSFGKASGVMLEILDKHINTLGHVEPGQEAHAAGLMIGDAFGVGSSAYLAGILTELVYPTKQLGLDRMVELMAELAGFRAASQAWHTPRLRHAINLPANYEAAARHRSTKPSAGEAGEMYARRIIGRGTFDQYMAWAGFDAGIIDQFEQNYFRPMSPFVLMAGVDDTPIDAPAFRDMAQFYGMRDKDIPRFLDIVRVKSIKSVRQQYLSAAVGAVIHGARPASSLTPVFHQLDLDPLGRGYILDHISWARRERLVNEYVSAWRTQALSGAISPQQYRVALEHLGMESTEVGALVGLVDAHLAADQAKLAEHEAERLRREVEAEDVRAAMARYRAGDLNKAGLTAALLAAGLTPALTQAYLSLATAVDQRDHARLQHTQQRDVEELYLKGEITRAVAEADLERFGMTHAEAAYTVQYLDARNAKKA